MGFEGSLVRDLIRDEGTGRIVELPAFPERADDAHKGDVGRIVVVGGRLDSIWQ